MAEAENSRVEDPALDLAVQALMDQVGARVRNAREGQGLTRRVLSEMSGVSPRYLAQLEAGEGNISIGLLKRVASALDRPVEWFVEDEDPQLLAAKRIALLFRSADAATREMVVRLLDPAASGTGKAQRICLIGLRGAGKSTLGAMLGATSGIPFVELNREIEAQAGMPLAEIMALYDQDGYRKLEAEALAEVIRSRDRVILAVAGGIVAEAATFTRLLERFHTVWLRTSPEEHMDRVRAQGDTRPMAGNPTAMAQLRLILAQRAPLYAQADVQLETSGQTVDASLAALLRVLGERQILGGTSAAT